MLTIGRPLKEGWQNFFKRVRLTFSGIRIFLKRCKDVVSLFDAFDEYQPREKPEDCKNDLLPFFSRQINSAGVSKKSVPDLKGGREN